METLENHNQRQSITNQMGRMDGGGPLPIRGEGHKDLMGPAELLVFKGPDPEG